ncbi:MAG: nucleotidyltransferase family protein [Chloroflexi bacterium]|nr:nucleotidyltransferase family protein [Chloroflexota bacterium]
METSIPGSMAHMQTDPHAQFLDIVLGNENIRTLTDRLAELELPDAYLAAGCLCQTVWNNVSGFPPDYGIIDYDVLYCDLDDLSWEGEDRTIRRCAAAFAELGVNVEVRNQARVHLWYPAKFGVPHQPLHSTKEGIDSFLHCCTALGLRKTPEGYDVYAPFGFVDVFRMVVRPNYSYGLPGWYEEKASRWKRTWPGVVVEPWCAPGPQ